MVIVIVVIVARRPYQRFKGFSATPLWSKMSVDQGLWALSSVHFKMSVPFNRWSWKLTGALPEMVQTIVQKDLTQYRSSPLLIMYYTIMQWFTSPYLLPNPYETRRAMWPWP